MTTVVRILIFVSNRRQSGDQRFASPTLPLPKHSTCYSNSGVQPLTALSSRIRNPAMLCFVEKSKCVVSFSSLPLSRPLTSAMICSTAGTKQQVRRLPALQLNSRITSSPPPSSSTRRPKSRSLSPVVTSESQATTKPIWIMRDIS